jgi:hypothetical protein
MAITLICIGIPVCRPLYKRAFRRLFGESSAASSSSGGYRKQSNNNAPHGGSSSNAAVPLRTIGGGLVDAEGRPLSVGARKAAAAAAGVGENGKRGRFRLGSWGKDGHADEKEGSDVGDGDGTSADDVSFSEVKLGVAGPFTRTTVGRGRRSRSGGRGGGNASDEEILDEYRRNQRDAEGDSPSARGGEHARRGHGHHGIMVTETYRVERS